MKKIKDWNFYDRKDRYLYLCARQNNAKNRPWNTIIKAGGFAGVAAFTKQMLADGISSNVKKGRSNKQYKLSATSEKI